MSSATQSTNKSQPSQEISFPPTGTEASGLAQEIKLPEADTAAVDAVTALSFGKEIEGLSAPLFERLNEDLIFRDGFVEASVSVMLTPGKSIESARLAKFIQQISSVSELVERKIEEKIYSEDPALCIFALQRLFNNARLPEILVRNRDRIVHFLNPELDPASHYGHSSSFDFRTATSFAVLANGIRADPSIAKLYTDSIRIGLSHRYAKTAALDAFAVAFNFNPALDPKIVDKAVELVFRDDHFKRFKLDPQRCGLSPEVKDFLRWISVRNDGAFS